MKKLIAIKSLKISTTIIRNKICMKSASTSLNSLKLDKKNFYKLILIILILSMFISCSNNKNQKEKVSTLKITSSPTLIKAEETAISGGEELSKCIVENLKNKDNYYLEANLDSNLFEIAHKSTISLWKLNEKIKNISHEDDSITCSIYDVLKKEKYIYDEKSKSGSKANFDLADITILPIEALSIINEKELKKFTKETEIQIDDIKCEVYKGEIKLPAIEESDKKHELDAKLNLYFNNKTKELKQINFDILNFGQLKYKITKMEFSGVKEIDVKLPENIKIVKE